MSKKFILTEAQIQMIAEYSLKNELRHPDDPMAYMDDQESHMSDKIEVDGPFEMVDFADKEYLLKNRETGEGLYAIGDGFQGDIYHALHDYLSIPQDREANEDGEYWADQDGWEDTISDEELADAVTNYANDQYGKNLLKATDNPQDFIDNPGDKYEFLVITPELFTYSDLSDVILNHELLMKAESMFQS